MNIIGHNRYMEKKPEEVTIKFSEEAIKNIAALVEVLMKIRKRLISENIDIKKAQEYIRNGKKFDKKDILKTPD